MLFGRALFRTKSTAAAPDAAMHFDDIPSPRGLPLIGTTLDLIAAGGAPQLHNYVDKRHRELGGVFKEKLGPTSCVFVSDPEVIKRVFEVEGKYPQHFLPEAWVEYNRIYGCKRGIFFMDGPEWWHYRRITGKMLLGSGNNQWMPEACDIVTDHLVESLSASDEDKCYENLTGALYKWSLDSIIAILLGAETYKQHRQDLEEQVSNLSKNVHSVFETSAKLSLIPVSLASRLKLPPWNRFVEAVQKSLADSNSLVATLTDLHPTGDGLLPKLIAAQVETEYIQRIIVDLILAAGDTTAVTFEWMLYLVSKNRQYQEKLRTEPGLARHVMREALRLYPVATFITRILPADAVVGGYEMPKGTLIVMSFYTTGRDERFFQDADTFKPERWGKDGGYQPVMQKACMPFAIGTRTCVGKRLAEVQLVSSLIQLVHNFDIELCNEKEVEMVMKMVAVPSEPLQLKFHRR